MSAKDDEDYWAGARDDDYGDEPIYLPPFLAERHARQKALIEANTPRWVDACRAKGHFPAMMSDNGSTWWCVGGCGDDRPGPGLTAEDVLID